MKRHLKIIIYLLVLCGLIAGCHTNSIKSISKNNATLSWLNHPFKKSLWQEISNNAALNDNDDHPDVQAKITWYAQHPAYIDLLTQNAKPYLYAIYHETEKRNMPAEIALLPMVESNYDPFQYSYSGATGLWQIMPGTASGFGLRINWWYDGRRDILASTQAALDYIDYLHRFLHNDWLLAIAAYNCGEGTVLNAIHHNQKLNKPTDFWSLNLPYQTKMYVPKMLALSHIIQHAHSYNVTLPRMNNEPYLAEIPMDKQIDLTLIAELANTDLKTVRQLNPAFRRASTEPDVEYSILLPIDKQDTFVNNLLASTKETIHWKHHQVKSGESLIAIAKRYKTKPTIIKDVNHLSSNVIRVNQYLLIPMSSNATPSSDINTHANNIAQDHLPGPQKVNYTVKKGDTLTSIAKQYHLIPRQIQFWNNMKYKQALYPDTHLVLWVKKPAVTTLKPAHYTVKSGDTLGAIAKRYHTTTHEISNLNHLKNTLIKPGQLLTLPRPSKQQTTSFTPKHDNELIIHTVESGETLSEIAHYYHIPIKNILSWNHLATNATLKIGQKINIYL